MKKKKFEFVTYSSKNNQRTPTNYRKVNKLLGKDLACNYNTKRLFQAVIKNQVSTYSRMHSFSEFPQTTQSRLQSDPFSPWTLQIQYKNFQAILAEVE